MNKCGTAHECAVSTNRERSFAGATLPTATTSNLCEHGRGTTWFHLGNTRLQPREQRNAGHVHIGTQNLGENAVESQDDM